MTRGKFPATGAGISISRAHLVVKHENIGDDNAQTVQLEHTNELRAYNFAGTAGNVATLRLTLKQGEGESLNEIVSTGTGKARGFKLAHQAIGNSIWVVPSNAPWEFNAEQNAVNSFACVFGHR